MFAPGSALTVIITQIEMEEIGLFEQGNMPNDGEWLLGRFRVKSNFSKRYNKNLSYYIGQP